MILCCSCGESTRRWHVGSEAHVRPCRGHIRINYEWHITVVLEVIWADQLSSVALLTTTRLRHRSWLNTCVQCGSLLLYATSLILLLKDICSLVVLRGCLCCTRCYRTSQVLMSHVRRKHLLEGGLLLRVRRRLLVYNLTLSNLCSFRNVAIRCAQSRWPHLSHQVVLCKRRNTCSFDVKWVANERSFRTCLLRETSLPLLVTFIRVQSETLIDKRSILWGLRVCTRCLLSVATEWNFLWLTPTVISWGVSRSWLNQRVVLLETSWYLVVCSSSSTSFASLCWLVLIITLTGEVFAELFLETLWASSSRRLYSLSAVWWSSWSACRARSIVLIG